MRCSALACPVLFCSVLSCPAPIPMRQTRDAPSLEVPPNVRVRSTLSAIEASGAHHFRVLLYIGHGNIGDVRRRLYARKVFFLACHGPRYQQRRDARVLLCEFADMGQAGPMVMEEANEKSPVRRTFHKRLLGYVHMMPILVGRYVLTGYMMHEMACCADHVGKTGRAFSVSFSFSSFFFLLLLFAKEFNTSPTASLLRMHLTVIRPPHLV